MLIGISVQVVNLLILVGYFIWHPDRTVWPERFIFWAWLPFVFHVHLCHLIYSLAATVRYIARIYLIENYGPDYDERLLDSIQCVLLPDWSVSVTIVWYAVHVISFTAILFFQGWGTVLTAELGVILCGGILPIRYQSHLKQLLAQAKRLEHRYSMELVGLTAMGVSMHRLRNLIDQGVAERRNPRRWWKAVSHDAIVQEWFGSNELQLATRLNNVAMLHRAQGKHEEAELVFKRSLAIRERVLGPDHPDVAAVLENYASLLWATQRESEAAPMEARAAAIRAKRASE